jgi:hypothetical protein
VLLQNVPNVTHTHTQKNRSAHSTNIQHHKMTKYMIHHILNSDNVWKICFRQASSHTFDGTTGEFKLDYNNPTKTKKYA